MKHTSFVLYYNYEDLEYCDGKIENDDVLYIAEYDEDDGFIRRVDKSGNEIEMDISVEEMEQMDFTGDGKSTPQESYNCLLELVEMWEGEDREDRRTCTMVPYGDTWVEYWS